MEALKQCPECGEGSGAGVPRRPLWARWYGLPMWVFVVVLGVLALQSAKYSVFSKPVDYLFWHSSEAGMTVGQLRRAADGDASERQRLVNEVRALLREHPDAIGTAELGLTSASACGGTVRERAEFGLVPWIGVAQTTHYRELGAKVTTPNRGDGPRWTGSVGDLVILWSDVGTRYPNRFFSVDGKPLLVLVCAFLIAAALVQKMVRRGRVAAVLIGVVGLVLLCWPRIGGETRFGMSPGWVSVGAVRSGSDEELARTLISGVSRRLDDWNDVDQLVVSWSTVPFAKATQSVIATRWGTCFSQTEYPLSEAGAAGEREGFSFDWGKVVRYRAVSNGALRESKVSLTGVAHTLAPVLLIACLPRGAWMLWRGCTSRRREERRQCRTCGYQLS